MSLKKTTPVSAGDENGMRVALNSLLEEAKYNDVEVTFTSTITPQRVAHGLGRALRGWFIIRKNFNGNVYETNTLAATIPDLTREINLLTSATGRATVRFF